MQVEHLLHFPRPHLEPGRDDHVLGAVHEIEPPRLVHEADVAGAQLTIPERRRRLLRLPPVPRNDLRARDHQLANLARQRVESGVGDDANVGVEHRHADRDHPGLGIDGRHGAMRRHVRGRRGFRQPVHRMDPRPGARVPLVENPGRRRRPAGIHLGQRRHVVLAHRLAVEQRDESGDGGHRERGPVPCHEAARLLGVEPVEQDQRAAREQGQAHMADQSGHMEQRRHPEDGVGVGQPDPSLIDGGGEHDVAVGVQGRLRLPRRARRVDHEGGGIAGQLDRFGRLAGVLCHQRDEVRHLEVAHARRSRQHARRFRARRQEIERGRRDRVLHVRRRHGRARHVGVEVVLADQHAAPGVVENLLELPLPQHRIARHDDRAAFPGRQHGHNHLRDVLHVHRNAIAGLGPVLLEGDGQGVGHRVELTRGQRAIEVVHQRGIGSATLQRGPEHLQRGRAAGLDRGRMHAVEVSPRTMKRSSHHDSHFVAPSPSTVATRCVSRISRW